MNKKDAPQSKPVADSLPSVRLFKKYRFSKTQLGAFVIIFALVGGYFIYKSFAATTPSTKGGIGYFRLGDGGLASNPSQYDLLLTSVNGVSAASNVPNTRAIVYMSGVDVSQSYFTGMNYSTAQSNNWLLKDSSGALLYNQSYPNSGIADVGNPAYQQAFVDNIAAYLAQNNLDGVFLDDTCAQIKGLANAVPAKYPNQTDWENAMVSFVQNVGTQLRQKGYYVVLNADGYISGDSASDDGSGTARYWARLAPYVGGLMNEAWMQNINNTSQLRASGSANYYDNWEGWLNIVNAAQNGGADFIGLTYGPPTPAENARYGRASFLMAWNGGGGAFMYSVGGGGSASSTDPWNPEWTTNIGIPTGAKYSVGVGYRRDFTNGTAIINPSGSSSQVFNLGTNYKKPDGTSVSSVTLGPRTALILSSSTATAPPSSSTSPPTSSLSASPTSINTGSTTTLTWSSTNTTSCSASDSWSGSLAASGTKSIAPTTTSTYSISCTGSGGNASATTTVTVNATNTSAKPASPTGLTGTPGDNQVVLKWSANPVTDNVDYYQVYEAGKYLVLNVPATQTSYTVTKDHLGTGLVDGTTYSFRVSAHNSTGYGDWSNAVSATPVGPASTPTPAPIVTLTASPSSTVSGDSSTLSWSSTNSSSCSASGAWSGTKATSGTSSVSPTSTSTYSLTCTGAGGSTSSSVTIAVSAPSAISPPPITTTDTTNPSIPANFRVTATGKSNVTLAWNASTDNVAVAGYKLYRNGSLLVDTAPTVLTVNNTDLKSGSAYNYYVVAYDKAGNVSARSQKVCVGKWNWWSSISRSRGWSYC